MLEQCLEHALEHALERLHCRPGRMRSGLNRRVWNTVWNRQSLHLSARTPICVLSHSLSLEHALPPGMAKARTAREGLSWLS